MSDVESVVDRVNESSESNNDNSSDSNNDESSDINNDEIGQEIIDMNHRRKLSMFNL